MTGIKEGWGVVRPGDRKAHYYRDMESLCRKIGFYRGELESDEFTSTADCATCRRLLDAEIAKPEQARAVFDRLVLEQFPEAAAVEYSCSNDPLDVCLWSVSNGRGRLLFNSNVATGKSWPRLGYAVKVFVPVARSIPERGDGLIYRLGSGGAR